MLNSKKTHRFNLTPEWPSSLPTHCEKCDNAYDARFSLEVGPSRLGRALKKSAPLISILILVLFLTRNDSMVLNSLGMTALSAVGLYLAGSLCPHRTRLYCHNCGYTEYLPILDSWEHS